MSRINTNVASLIGQHVLGHNNTSLNTSLERLSTGLRINRGKDDPAGLIASENLRAEKTALDTAIGNAERADQVANIAEGGLDEVSRLLNELQGLLTQTANDGGLSQEEKQANQLQIDSILQTIDRVADATSFQGTKLLNGNFDYTTTNVSGQVAAFNVNGAKLSFGETRNVEVLVYGSAQAAGYLLSFGGDLDLGSAGEQFVVEIAGALGSRELSFASGTSLADIAAAINSFSDVVGVNATVSTNLTSIRLDSTGYGSDQFVSIKVVDDGNIAAGDGIHSLAIADTATAQAGATAFTTTAAANGLTDFGQDVEATINGIVATTKGTHVRINTDFLDVELDLVYDTGAGAANAAILGAFTAFTIEGGGADFQLAGRVDIAGRVSLGIQSVAARNIGRSTVDINGTDFTYFLKDLSTGAALNVVDGNTDAAQHVVEKSIKEISTLRGRLGAFQKNTVGATIRSLGIALENTTAAESVIRDADFAEETAKLTRGQILVSSATQILAIANSQPQNALQLLG
ncbi:MAG: flagellin [Phycisphaerales bacterium]|nr:flagellin [Phycisphaerales bacterium]